MKVLPIGRYRFFQKIQPLFLLNNLTTKSATGCLQVFTASASWSIFLEKGKLTYACCSDKMFELLYKHLQHARQQIPTLHSGIIEQLQAIFETGIENQAIPNPDYLAICWLVKQKYINSAQAGILIEELSLKVLQSFLTIQEGSYEFTVDSFLDDLPKFCHLDVNLLIHNCQKQSKNSRSQTPSQFNRRTQPQPQTINEQQLPQRPRQNGSQAVQSSNRILSSPNQTNNNNRQPNQENTDKELYTVICIDDSPAILNAIKRCLDDQIFFVIGINDPLKALMQILRTKPDLILLDIQMPNLDGYELCSLLRKHSYFKNTPVIMVTAKTGLIDRAKAKLVRASGYLTKPFTQADLMKMVFQHIR